MNIIIISLLLLVSLLPNPTFTAHVGIVNGTEAEPHSRPYMVSLQEKEKHVFGGFLISDQFVLTAAHCYDKDEPMTVVIGAHALTENNLQRYNVKSYIPHPDFNSKTGLNDIMLLKLEERVRLNTKVGLIALPENGDVKVGCSVAGWGRLTDGKRSDRLMEAKTKILSDAECEDKWGLYYKPSQMICAYGYGGSCKGDSGGPLVCGKKPTAAGVTSFGGPGHCNSPKHPEVYTKISAFIRWIHKEIGK